MKPLIFSGQISIKDHIDTSARWWAICLMLKPCYTILSHVQPPLNHIHYKDNHDHQH